jgi:LemA protein
MIMLGIVIVLALLGVLFLYVVGIYNRLVLLRNRYQNAFAQIEVQLKRRYDLIPNLVETAKGYISQDRETQEAEIAARNTALAMLEAAKAQPGAGAAMAGLGRAEGGLSDALGRLSVVMEAYPDLKANTTMMQLSEELTSTENRVAFARQAYNDQVTDYNSYRQSFPPTLFAQLFGHPADAALLEFADSAQFQAAPKVGF